MADTVYRTPIVLSADGKSHVPGQAGDKIDPGIIPLDPSDNNLLKPGNGGIILTPDDLISKEPNNSLVASTADGKLKVDANKLVAPNDPLLSVADNRIKSTLTVELTSAGQLILKGTGGKTVGSVTLPVVPGLPTVAEFLTNFTPPSSAGVIGGGGKGNYLHLQFAMSNGTTKDLYINYTAMAGGGGDSTTINPADLIQAGGGLAIEGGKIKVDCAGIKSCITSTVSGNFLANGGLTTDANGKFKVDWTKAPSDSSGGEVASSGLTIGEKKGEYAKPTTGSSTDLEWVITDIVADKMLFIVVKKYKMTGGGAVPTSSLAITRPFVTFVDEVAKTTDTTWTPSSNNSVSVVNGCAYNENFRGKSSSGTYANYVEIAPNIAYSSSTWGQSNGVTSMMCQHYSNMVSNVFMFIPDKAYSTLTINIHCSGCDFELEAYQ